MIFSAAWQFLLVAVICFSSLVLLISYWRARESVAHDAPLPPAPPEDPPADKPLAPTDEGEVPAERWAERLAARLDAATPAAPQALVCLAVDHLDRYKDLSGAEAGAALHDLLAEVLRALGRPVIAWTATRQGVFELLLACDADDAMPVILHLIKDVREKRFAVRGQSLRMTISAGLAGWPADGCAPEALREAARVAWRKGAASGGSQGCRYDASMRDAPAAAAPHVAY